MQNSIFETLNFTKAQIYTTTVSQNHLLNKILKYNAITISVLLYKVVLITNGNSKPYLFYIETYS